MLTALIDNRFDDSDAELRSRMAFNLIEEKGRLGIWSWNLQTDKMKWSTGVYRLLGLEPGSVEPSYDLLESLSHPADLRPPEEIERLFSEGGIIERRFRIFQPDGRVRWVLDRGEFYADQSGKSTSAMGILTDITWLHKVEAKSEALQNRLSFLIEASSAVMWILNADGYPGDRRGWCKLTGQTLAETQNSGWLDAIHPDDRDRIQDIWNSAVGSRTPYQAEYRIRTADGSYRWFRAHAVPVPNEDKSVREWLTACFDVHDKKMTSPVLGNTRITGAQIRAARGILNWSVRDIAEAANISASSIRRLEETDAPSNDPEDVLHILPSLRETFEAAGVEFLFSFAGKPGVRPRS